MHTLTHGLSGYEFPDLLPFINSGRKTAIHCATIEVVHSVHAYIWVLQPANTTIHLMDNDPLSMLNHRFHCRFLSQNQLATTPRDCFVGICERNRCSETIARYAWRQEDEMGRSIVCAGKETFAGDGDRKSTLYGGEVSNLFKSLQMPFPFRVSS
ncbi:hypothetical protein B0H14DRAFT_2864275 [Mycena olivaceomarginata]|nr:hypothetical protein B0H14DRAFT_2864275 [Mycena olivaceomarginata]